MSTQLTRLRVCADLLAQQISGTPTGEAIEAVSQRAGDRSLVESEFTAIVEAVVAKRFATLGHTS